jgi:hypothetical protein
MKAQRFKCYLLGKLLWILLNWEICSVFKEGVRQATNSFLSMYKCFSIIKHQAFSLKKLITCEKKKLLPWLMDLYATLAKYGLKENKKGRKSLIKLLRVKPV